MHTVDRIADEAASGITPRSHGADSTVGLLDEQANGESPHDAVTSWPSERAPSKRAPSKHVSYMFACPFFKRDPQKYSVQRSCPGPGWDSVHRLKEHIYRQHRLSPFCPRCGESFKEERLLMEHLRSDDSCQRRLYTAKEGVTTEQELQLRSRKRLRMQESEEEKWKRVYAILFPHDDPESIPSPYYELAAPSSDSRTDALFPRPSKNFAELLDAVKHDLHRDLTRALENELTTSPITNPSEDHAAQIHSVIKQTIDKTFATHIAPENGISGSSKSVGSHEGSTIDWEENQLNPFMSTDWLQADLANLPDFSELSQLFAEQQESTSTETTTSALYPYRPLMELGPGETPSIRPATEPSRASPPESEMTVARHTRQISERDSRSKRVPILRTVEESRRGEVKHDKEHRPPSSRCSICGSTFAHLKDLRRHERGHTAPQMKCPHEGCDVTVRRADNLRRHIAQKHGSKPTM